MKTLKERLKGELKNIYLVQGEDFCLFEKAKNMIIKAAGISLTDFNVVVFDDESFAIKDFILACESLPMLDEKKVIILKNIAKISEGDKKILQDYAKNPILSTVVIVLDYFKVFDFLKTKAEFVDAKRLDRELLVKIIVKSLKELNKTISSEAAEALIDSTNGYLTKIENEILKIAHFSSDELITKSVIDSVVSKDLEYTIFELTDSLSKKQADKALKLLSLMEKEPGTLALISNHFRRMFFASLSDKSTHELSQILNVKEFAVVKAREQAKAFSKSQLKKIHSLLEEVDYFVKSGQMQLSNALYYLVFSILYI